MTFRRPDRRDSANPQDDWLVDDPFSAGQPASARPRNGTSRPLAPADAPQVQSDPFGTMGSPATPPAAPNSGGEAAKPPVAPGRQGRVGRLRNRGRQVINTLAPFTLPPPATTSTPAAGTGQPARRMARRAGSAALGSIPTFGRLRRAGNGSIMGGLRFMANRNPLYRYFLSRLPVGGKAQAAIATGCGCVSGCGCGSSCCSCVGCFWPVIIIFIVIGMSGVWAERQPGFVKPLFCERTQAAFCSPDSVGLGIQLGDLPPGSVEDYQAVEAETGVPWFYLAAWEKVATDFGRADFSKIAGSSVQVPGPALDATYANLAKTVDGMSDPENLHLSSGTDPAIQAAISQALDEKKDEVARLTSPLRGGSFGYMLVNTAEYEAYGKNDDGTWKDPWVRKDAALMIAKHLVDIYPNLASGGTLTYDGTPAVPLIDTTEENWIHNQLLTIANDPSKAANFDKFLMAIGRAAQTPTCVNTYHNYGGVVCTQPTAGTPTEKWWDGPRANQDITMPERFYICQSILPEADVTGGACDAFLAGADTLGVDPKQALSDAIAVFYDREDTIVPGEAVSDWGKLQILVGALMSDNSAWGGDDTSYYMAPQITPEGRSGQEERVNAYAQAIVVYGHSIYDAWAAAQLAARADSGAGRAEAAALAFWGPPATQVEKETGFPREYLLATLKADGAFGCMPGQGSSLPDSAVFDWLDPVSITTGKGMGQGMGFTGLAWVPIAVQMQWENGGDVRGNNPGNMADDAGHASGTFTYPGQVGWWYGGNAVEHHWFAVFDTLTNGAIAAAQLYLRGLNDQNDWRGYAAVVNAGRAGDVLATARAIEASRWSSNHYGGNHILPGTNQLFHPDSPEKDGKIVRSSIGVSVATVGGCWRFGPGTAAPWTPPAQPSVNGAAIAMNYCLATMMAAPGGCGTAKVTANGKTVELPVMGFWDGDTGTAAETIAGLNGAAASELGLGGAGPWQVAIELVKPAEATWPPEVYGYATPADALRALVKELDLSAGIVPPAVPNLGQLAPAWRAHATVYSSCVIDRTQPTVAVADPFKPDVSYQIGPWCPYLSDVIRYANIFLGSAAGGSVSTIFGVEPVSRFGYIWPIVGARLTYGFEPRSYATSWAVTYGGQTADIHSGDDLSPGCSGQVVADKAGWLWTDIENGTVISAATGGKLIHYTTTVIHISHSDGITSSYGHVNGDVLDPALASQMASTTNTYKGHKAIWVNQGARLASLDDVGCHLHFEMDIYSVKIPFRYPFGGDAHARYFGQTSYASFMVIDPMTVLPQDNSMLRIGGNGKRLTSWYYTAYGPNGWPQVYNPSQLFGTNIPSGTTGGGTPTPSPSTSSKAASVTMSLKTVPVQKTLSVANGTATLTLTNKSKYTFIITIKRGSTVISTKTTAAASVSWSVNLTTGTDVVTVTRKDGLTVASGTLVVSYQAPL